VLVLSQPPGSSSGKIHLQVGHEDIVEARHVVDRSGPPEGEEGDNHSFHYAPVAARRELHYVELNLRRVEEDDDGEADIPGTSASGHGAFKRPQVRCDSERAAAAVAAQVNRAVDAFEERAQALPDEDGDNGSGGGGA